MAARSKRAIRQLLPMFLAAENGRVTVAELQHELGGLSYRLGTYVWNLKDRLMANFEVEREQIPAASPEGKARSVVVAYRLTNPDQVKLQMERRVASGSMTAEAQGEALAQPTVTEEVQPETSAVDTDQVLEAVSETPAADAAVAIAEPVFEAPAPDDAGTPPTPVDVAPSTDADPLAIPAFLDKRGKPLTGAALKAAQRKAATVAAE